jgi:hypothetical protein
MGRIPGWMLSFTALTLALGCGPEERTQDTGQPEPPAPDCPDGTVADGESCVPEACGVGTWGDLPTDEATVFVDGAAAEGGDGSATAPFTSIQAAADAASSAGGGLVAVAAGTYSEGVILESHHAGIVLAGRCADLVTLDASVGGAGDAGLTIDTRAGLLEVSGMTVDGSNYMGVFIVSGDVTLRELTITENAYTGLYIMSAFIGSSSSVLVEDCEIAQNTAAGVNIESNAAAVIMRRVLVRDSQRGGINQPGVGIGVVTGATLLLESSELARNRAEGLLLRDQGTVVQVSDTLIHDTLPGDGGVFGYGIQASGGASLSVEGCEIAQNTHAGVTVVEAGTEALIRDTLIRDTQPTEDGAHGSGIEVGDGASLTLESSEITGFRIFGVGVTGAGTVASIDGTTLRDAVGADVVPSGLGVVALDQATVQVSGSTISNVAGMGLAALESGSSMVVTDTTISGTRNVGALGQYGIGMAAGIGASLEASGCEITGSGTIGVLASDPGSWVLLEDVQISDTRRGDAYTVGVGVATVQGASLSASQLAISQTDGPGLYAMSLETSLDCEDCTVQGSAFAGAVAEQGAALSLSRSAITDTSAASNVGGGVGLWARATQAEPTSLELTDSTVSGNPVGGVWLSGPGSFRLQDNTLQGGEGETRGTLVRCGDAVYARDGATAWDGATGLYLEGNTLRDGNGAGLFLDGATATLAGNDWDANKVDIVAQGGSCAVPPEGMDAEAVGSTELCPTWDYSTCSDEFELYMEIAVPEGS